MGVRGTENTEGRGGECRREKGGLARSKVGDCKGELTKIQQLG